MYSPTIFKRSHAQLGGYQNMVHFIIIFFAFMQIVNLIQQFNEVFWVILNIKTNFNCVQMDISSQRKKSFQIERNPALLTQSLLNMFNLEEQNLAQKLSVTFFTCTLGSLVSLRDIYEPHRLQNKISKWNFFHRLKYTVFSTFNIQTCISFGFKTFLDNFGIYAGIKWNQYHKGLLVGIFSYMRNTPIKYVRQIQEMIRGRNRQRINYYQAKNFLTQTYGWQRLYPGYSSINLFNSVLFFTLYFGVYSTLNQYTQHFANFYILNPLLATVIAMVPTFLISKMGNLMYSIKKSRQDFAIGMGRKVMVFHNTVNQEFFRNIGDIFKLTPLQKHMQLKQLTSSWMQLMFFVFGQTIIYQELCKNGLISEIKPQE